MNNGQRRGWLLAGVLLLAGCDGTGRLTPEERQARLDQVDALAYRDLCVEAVERRRVMPRVPQGLPPALDGQACGSAVLANYAVAESKADLVQSSVIRLDATRLSGYRIEIQGRDGKLYTAEDRGVAAAAAEQKGTFEAAPALSEE